MAEWSTDFQWETIFEKDFCNLKLRNNRWRNWRKWWKVCAVIAVFEVLKTAITAETSLYIYRTTSLIFREKDFCKGFLRTFCMTLRFVRRKSVKITKGILNSWFSIRPYFNVVTVNTVFPVFKILIKSGIYGKYGHVF